MKSGAKATAGDHGRTARIYFRSGIYFFPLSYYLNKRKISQTMESFFFLSHVLVVIGDQNSRHFYKSDLLHYLSKSITPPKLN
jgi:hypothetical protein